MQAKDVMSQPVIAVASNASIFEAVRLMLQNKISGLPVVDVSGSLVGIVSEGDFLRRTETGTLRRRPRWIEFLVGPGKLAEEYVHASGRRVDGVMTTDVHTTVEDAALDQIVDVMERHRIKRVPVMRGQQMVGIVTRANLLHALIYTGKPASSKSLDDTAIREQLLSHLDAQKWAPTGAIDVEVNNAVVTLSGVLTDERQRRALCVAAENIPGVKRVEDRLVWVLPEAGIIGQPPVVVGPAQE